MTRNIITSQLNNETIKGKCSLEVAAVTLLLIAEICFYRIGSLNLYFPMTGFGIIVGVLWIGLRYWSRYLNVKSFPFWLTLIYLLFLFSGFFRLQKGDFPWDNIVYRYIENLAMYYLFRKILSTDENKIVYPFIIAGLFSFGYLIMTEGTVLLAGYTRIGNLMSGNVNTVGYNFGIISMVTMWWYCKEKKWYKLVIFLIFAVVMLLTGSKKVLIIIVLDFALLFMCDRSHASRWLKFGLSAAAVIYLIFNIPIFYEIIGFRVESMLETMIYGNSATIYSYSTDVRDNMIHEGFNLFLKKPVLGGGWNYFYSRTIYGYDYSHNNYIEILCSFGIVGFVLYYCKHISNLIYEIKSFFRHRKLTSQELLFAFVLSVTTILLDWAAVSFSAVCVWYVPLIIASAIVENSRKSEYNI